LIVIVNRARTRGIALMEVFAVTGLRRRPFRIIIWYPHLQSRPRPLDAASSEEIVVQQVDGFRGRRFPGMDGRIHLI
jgi:hypothetical protein